MRRPQHEETIMSELRFFESDSDKLARLERENAALRQQLAKSVLVRDAVELERDEMLQAVTEFSPPKTQSLIRKVNLAGRRLRRIGKPRSDCAPPLPS